MVMYIREIVLYLY